MTLPPPPLIDGCLIVDNSLLESLQNCPYECQLSRINKRVTIERRDGLNFGSCCHLMLAERYRRYDAGVVDDLTPLIAIAEEHFAQNPPTPGDHRTLNMATEFISAYNRMYPREDWSIAKLSNGQPFIERSFISPIAELYGDQFSPCNYLATANPSLWVSMCKDAHVMPIFYAGRIDLSVVDSTGPWVVDNKSAYQMGKNFSLEMLSTPQLRGYCWEHRNYYGSLPKGYIINAFRVRPPTRDAQFDETKLFRTKGIDPDFLRIPQTITDVDINEWLQNTYGLIEELLWHHNRGRFGRHKKNCVSKYGACQFYELCNNVAPEYRDDYLQSGAFMDNVWSPLNLPQTPTPTTKTQATS